MFQGYLAAMQTVLARSHGGWADHESLREIQRCCWAALLLAEDDESRQQLDLLLTYATDLFSDQAHLRWAIGPLFGVDVLRRKISRTLAALGSQPDAQWLAPAEASPLRAA